MTAPSISQANSEVSFPLPLVSSLSGAGFSNVPILDFVIKWSLPKKMPSVTRTPPSLRLTKNMDGENNELLPASLRASARAPSSPSIANRERARRLNPANFQIRIGLERRGRQTAAR